MRNVDYDVSTRIGSCIYNRSTVSLNNNDNVNGWVMVTN